jgi:hypothetical protein
MIDLVSEDQRTHLAVSTLVAILQYMQQLRLCRVLQQLWWAI